MNVTSLVRRARHIKRIYSKYAHCPKRYRQVLQAVAKHRPATIVEIGVFRGVRALEMIDAAALSRPLKEVCYFGFDLFEEMTSDIHKSELSKWPDPEETIRRRLEVTGASISLYKGFTEQTLPQFVEARAGANIDFAFIDGGHAIETILADWENVAAMSGPETQVLLDDYYVDCPERIKKFGCNAVLETLDPARNSWEVLEDVDRFVDDDGPLNVAIAKVTFRR